MEILRFDESDAPAPKKKRPSKGWLALGLVAALMGIGTAFASSTININGGNPIQIGQGITQTASCQGSDSIQIRPNTAIDTSQSPASFYIKSLDLKNVNSTDHFYIDDNGVEKESTSAGCAGLDFKVQIWHNKDNPVPYKCVDDGGGPMVGGSGYPINGLDYSPVIVSLANDSGSEISPHSCVDSLSDSTLYGQVIFRIQSGISDYRIIFGTQAKISDFDYVTIQSGKYLS